MDWPMLQVELEQPSSTLADIVSHKDNIPAVLCKSTSSTAQAPEVLEHTVEPVVYTHPWVAAG